MVHSTTSFVFKSFSQQDLPTPRGDQKPFYGFRFVLPIGHLPTNTTFSTPVLQIYLMMARPPIWKAMFLPVLYNKSESATEPIKQNKTSCAIIHLFHEDAKLIGSLFDSQRQSVKIANVLRDSSHNRWAKRQWTKTTNIHMIRLANRFPKQTVFRFSIVLSTYLG